MSKSHWIVSGAVALTALLGATAASAANHNNHQPDVRWSVTVGNPAPVYVQRGPVYPQPYPVYRVDDRYGHHHQHRPHDHYREPTRWDRDGDGIPNRHDRVYNPRWDVDGDGIPNRHDRDGRGHGHWRR